MRVLLNNFEEPYEKFHTKQVHNTKTDSTKDYTVKLSHLKKERLFILLGLMIFEKTLYCFHQRLRVFGCQVAG